MKKKCPRCHTKTASTTVVCPDCQLNYQKFEQATNKEAKINMQQGEKDQILMRKGCPSDVKKWKLILITLFLGFMGGHHYYVGRYKMGIFYTIFFIVGVTNGVIMTMLKTPPTGFIFEIFNLLVLTWGAVLFMWIIDIAKVLFNRYKIPVSRTID